MSQVFQRVNEDSLYNDVEVSVIKTNMYDSVKLLL